jgi:hypothetical protein
VSWNSTPGSNAPSAPGRATSSAGSRGTSATLTPPERPSSAPNRISS